MKQAIQTTTFLFFLLYNTVTACAQKKTDFKQQIFGKGGRDIAKHIIVNKQGQYVIVGSSANWFLGNDDNIFFTIVDPKKPEIPLLKAIPIGGRFTEGANSVVQTRDGGYVIAGFTDSVKHGKREAWLVKVSERGLGLWNTTVSTPEDDVFSAITEAPNGDLWMTGQSGGKLWVVKTDAQGQNEKLFTSYSPVNTLGSVGNALAWDANGRHLMIVGSQVMQFPAGQNNLIVARFDTEGEDFTIEKDYPNAEGNGIVRDRTGNFGIIGTTYQKPKGDILFMYADATCDTFNTCLFGKNNVKEVGLGIAQDWDGHFLLVGEFYKEVKSNTTQGWIKKIKNDGSTLLDFPEGFGGTGNDAFLAALTSERGDNVATGKRYKGGASDGWLFVLPPSVSTTHDLAQKRGKIDLDIQGGRFHDDEDSSMLRKNKRGFYDFWIENKDSADVFGLVARVLETKNKPKANNREYEKIVIGTLRGKERRLVTIPFQGSPNLGRNEWDFTVKFLAQKDTLALEHDFHLSTRDALKYKLDTAHTFPSDVWAGKVVHFSFTLKNTGDLTAQNVQVRVDVPIGTRIKLLGKNRMDLEDIAVGETRSAHFSFEVGTDFVSEVLLLPVFVAVNGVKYGIEYPLVAQVHADTTTKVVAYVKKPLRLIWKDGKDSIAVTKPYHPLQLIVESDNELNRKDHVRVLINGRDNTGEKFDNIRLIETKSAGTYQHRYDLVFQPSLQMGKTEIKIIIDDGNNTKQTRLVIQRMEPPNLYVLAVGVDYDANKNIPSLSFTGTDARSIDSVFNTQAGKKKIFDNVTTIPLTNAYQTRGKYIKQQLIDLAAACKETDVFIVLLSGHGGIMDFKSENIQFLGSDYDPTNPNTYLDYNTDIKAVLDKAKGQKLLLLDACQKKLDKSGTVEEDQLSEAIERVIRATPSFRALLSCSKGESSWESGKYGHGAFTQAILEALRNQTVFCSETEQDCNANVDPNGAEPTNRFLTFQELARFVKKRVPVIVKEIGLTQTPTERDDQPDEDVPIFWFDK